MIHPQSYVHSIIRFKNGLIKMILYDTDMKIPISNTLYGEKNNLFNKSQIDTNLINQISGYICERIGFIANTMNLNNIKLMISGLQCLMVQISLMIIIVK